ncbi:MAG: hypothetical protein J1F18_05620 [Lachnospiraceae bacterium]|nr:hypothetical protein [Lachnospiraceae bacterium]
MINDKMVDSILEVLESKLNLTEMQKDIIDSIRDLKKDPLDRNAIISRIKENKAKYGDMILKTLALFTIQTGELPVYKFYDDLSDDELQINLITQIKVLFAKS